MGKQYEEFLTLLGHDVYNPFDADQEAIDISAAFKQNCNMKIAHDMVDKDKTAILSSDMVVALLPPCERHSVGTILEIGFAHEVGVPVVVITDIWNHGWLMVYTDLIIPLTKESGLYGEQ